MPKKSKIIELQCGDCGQVFERLLRIHKEYLRLNKQKNKTDYVRNVSTNEKYFEMKNYMWDADVILHDHKIAVLWNGRWHYEQLRKGHSVKQVQARDRIKIRAIEKRGYIPYIIKDMGKHNKKFVEQQFELFKQFIEQLKTQ